MQEYGGIVVEATLPSALQPVVGSRITAVTPLIDLMQADCGFVVETETGASAAAVNLCDDLVVDAWPSAVLDEAGIMLR